MFPDFLINFFKVLMKKIIFLLHPRLIEGFKRKCTSLIWVFLVFGPLVTAPRPVTKSDSGCYHILLSLAYQAFQEQESEGARALCVRVIVFYTVCEHIFYMKV